jgi:hypothetical protein
MVILEDDVAEAPRPQEFLGTGERPMFGLVESSRSDATHAERGLYDQLEITELYDRLPALPGWDPPGSS